ncbi:thiamine phosphate synthase [Paracidobacterium acidisoli]|uniref:thiamine phosphate synthase n=1 Tax=Paracidobacterium acidisoli TaxID=2303751 RepID=UPI001314A3FF|nr:thiamine phosphate synthase [Paracidobacterium acidisoli]
MLWPAGAAHLTLAGVTSPQKFPSLYPILDAQLALPRDGGRRESLRRLMQELADAGVELLQYRNKQDSDAEVLEEALAMREAAPAAMRLILNDRAMLLQQTRFDGVHVGQEDMTPAAVRSMAGAQCIVGVSTHSEEQLLQADAEPVDYIAIGPVFATGSKLNPDPVVGLEGVRLARRLTAKPLVAIGGITLENAASVREAGADSVAVISAVFSAGNSAAEQARAFLRRLR